MKRGKSTSFEEEEEEVDRISSLPDSVIHHILSFMDMKYAVKTCILSRRWRFVWISLPVLEFDHHVHYRETEVEDDVEIATDKATERFKKIVNEVLNLRDNSDIQRFHLECPIYYTPTDPLYGCINEWITTAVRHNVQELYLKISPEGGFEIPPSLCTCKSLTKMELELSGGEGMDSKIVLPREMRLPRLKSLILRLEDISFDDEMLMNRFFSSFPSLESLVMKIQDYEFRNMNLHISLPKLEYFESEIAWTDDESISVRLNAPSLSSFMFSGYLTTPSFTLENLSSLVTADIKIDIIREDEVPESLDIHPEKKEFYTQRTMGLLRGIYKVKVITLYDSFLKALGGAPDLLDTQLPEFLNFQHLDLQTYLSRDCLRSIFFVLNNSPNMESISLQISQPFCNKPQLYPYCDEAKFDTENIGDYWDAGLSLPCMICHLKFVEIKGLRGCVNELKFLEILLKHATVLEKVVLASYSTEHDSQREKRMTKFSEMLLTFPTASKKILILFKF